MLPIFDDVVGVLILQSLGTRRFSGSLMHLQLLHQHKTLWIPVCNSVIYALQLLIEFCVFIDINDSSRRQEALLLQGGPVSNLSTEKIFEYCAYYSSTQVAQLEWG